MSTSAPALLRLTLPGHPPSPNRLRGHWSTRWKQTHSWRDDVTYLARAQRPDAPYPVAKVTITFEHRQHHFRDEDNLVASCKPILDGLRLGGVIVDDSPDHITLDVRQVLGAERQIVIEVTPQ